MKRFPTNPSNPHRVCWGCDLYCASYQMRCGNGSVRTPHPAELFGDDWAEWKASPADAGPVSDAAAPVRPPVSDDHR